MTDEFYSIGKFAKLVGKSIRTLQRWDRDGILLANRTATGRRFYTLAQYHQVVRTSPAPEKEIQKNICYTRVSGNDQKNDLMSQKHALEQYIISNGIAVNEWLSDVGSGLNYKRKNFNYLLIEVENNRVARIIIAHKDRLVRIGYEWFDEFCKRHNCEIIVINAESLSPEEEVTKDLLTIIHCFSSRLYGLRRYKKEIIKMVVSNEND
jgi:putative resolvase